MDEELQLVTTVRAKKSVVPPPINITPRPDTLDLNRDVQILSPTRPIILQQQKSFTHNVTNSVQRTLDLGFTDLSYSVKMGIKRGEFLNYLKIILLCLFCLHFPPHVLLR